MKSARFQRVRPLFGQALRNRHGVTTVEFAVAAFVLFLVVAVSIEFSRMNMIRHTVDNAAYEGARAGIILGAEPEEIESEVNAIMAAVHARDVTIDIEPRTIQDDTPEVIVTVSTPADANGYITARFFGGKVFQGQCRLTRDDI